jgi:putative aldouronate transport system substrate-binding protein
MKSKNFCFAILILVLVLSPIFGAGRQAAPAATGATAVTSAPGQFPLARDRAQLSVLTQKAAYLSDFNNNHATQRYESLTNVRVIYTSVPQVGAREATNLLIAAGEYPDIIMSAGMNAADEMNYGSQGIFIPINDLIQNHAYWANEAFRRYPELPAALIQPDGNIYGLPNINEAFHTFYTMKAWINENWLRTLNLRVPATTEEFYQVLSAFKTQDPNRNGRADEIPMMGHYQLNTPRTDPWNFLLNSFVYFDPQTTKASGFLELVNRRVGFVPIQDDYREGLRYIARLVSEGLLDPASFTQNVNQVKQIGTNPDAQLIGVFTDFVWWNTVGYNRETADRRADNYPALAPLRGPRGVQNTPLTAVPFNVAFAHITDHCRDPILAFRWLDGLYNEDVTRDIQFGTKGVYWDNPASGAQGINRKPALHRILQPFPSDVEDPGSARNVLLGNRHSDLRLGEQADWANPETQFAQEPKLFQETNEKYAQHFPQGRNVPEILYFTPQENQDYLRLREQINTYTRENLVAFITGNRNLDRDWAAYINEFQRLELNRYLQMVQTAYDRQYGRR